MTLFDADILTKYTVDSIRTEDEGIDTFLFSLGCYEGEPIEVVSRNKNGCIVAIKDSRYSIDLDLARAISVR
ncbi:MAG: ferrous iron transport protein A [Clostridia bacterium]|nr:ferrous iron transport protein A [Clostridia bacterium]MBR7160191.1 ferrous iron transport protein A [Clostridia bacterium]